MPLWRALRVVSGARGSLKSTGLEAPFVGRGRELRQIKDLFHTCAEERKAHLISVTGIAGIGKSRLGWEFYKYFDGLPQLTYWHRGRCLAYGDGVTYWALADMVRMRCRIGEDEEPASALEKLRATLEEHIADPDELRVRRAARRTAARPGRAGGEGQAGSVRRLAPLLRTARRRLPDRARLRGHAVGRREPARLRRVPARVVAQLAALRDHAGATRAPRAPPELGCRPAQLQLPLPRAAPGACDGGAARRARAGPARRPARTDPRPRRRRAALCGRDRADAARPGPARPGRRRLPPARRDRLARGARDAARADRRPARRPLRRGAARAAGRGRARQDVHARCARRARRSPNRARAAAFGPRAQGGARPAVRPALARAGPVRLPAGSRPPRRLRDARQARAAHEAPRWPPST